MKPKLKLVQRQCEGQRKDIVHLQSPLTAVVKEIVEPDPRETFLRDLIEKLREWLYVFDLSSADWRLVNATLDTNIRRTLSVVKEAHTARRQVRDWSLVFELVEQIEILTESINKKPLEPKVKYIMTQPKVSLLAAAKHSSLMTKAKKEFDTLDDNAIIRDAAFLVAVAGDQDSDPGVRLAAQIVAGATSAPTTALLDTIGTLLAKFSEIANSEPKAKGKNN